MINSIIEVDARTLKKNTFNDPIKLETTDEIKNTQENDWDGNTILAVLGIFIAISALGVSLFSAKKDKTDLKKFVKGQRILQDGSTALVVKDYKSAKRSFVKYLENTVESGALISAGNASFYMKKFDDAFEFYEKAVSIDPDNSAAIHNMGVCLTAFDDYELGALFFRDAIRLDNSYQDAYSNLGLCLINTNRSQEGFRILNEAIKLDYRDPSPYIHKAQAYASQKKWTEALENINNALELDPHNIDALNQRGIILSDSKNHKESVICYNRVLEIDSINRIATYNKIVSLIELEQFKEAIPLIDRLLLFEPKNPSLLAYKGNCLFSLDKIDGSIYYLKKALKLVNRVSQRNLTINILNNLGIEYSEKDDLNRGLRSFNQCLQLNSNASKTWSNKGVCLAKFGKTEKGLQCIERALEIDSTDVFVLDKKARILSKLGRHDETLSVCDEILELTRDQNQEILELKANELGKQEKYDEAIKAFDKFLELKPEDTYILDKKALALSRQGKNDEAITIYNKILQKYPNDILTLTNKGAVLFIQNLFDRAITTCYDVILNLNSANTIAWSGKGYCLGRDGKFNQSLECFEIALSIDPENLTSLTGKASCLLDLGRYEKAVEVIKKILKIGNGIDFSLELKNIYNFERDHHTSLYFLSLAYAKLENYPKAWEYWHKHLKVLIMKKQIDETNPESKITVAMSWF